VIVDGMASSQLGAVHARHHGDVELDVVEERDEVGSVGRLDTVVPACCALMMAW
jgi:hypothetical protein